MAVHVDRRHSGTPVHLGITGTFPDPWMGIHLGGGLIDNEHSVRNMVDPHVDSWVFIQNILPHQYKTLTKKVHITLCQLVLQNCHFQSL